MTKPRVILKDQARYRSDEIAARAGEIIQGLQTEVRGKTVFVKPSFVYPSKSETVKGIITQPEFVAGVARALRDAGAGKVLVGESSVLGPARVTMAAVGVIPLLKGVAEPVFLDEVETIEVEVKHPFVQDRFKVPKIWLDADIYVSLPKIKTNMFAELTLTIKNNLGLLRQRDRLLYHDHRLHKKLADLFTLRPPDLVIADCIVAGEGQGPLMADPVELGLMVGGNNAVAVDVVACHLTGYDPIEEIEHLRLLIEAGYGPGSLDGVEIEGRDLLSRARPFRRPATALAGLSPRLRVFEGTEVSCPWGCASMVRGVMDAYIQRDGPDGIQPMNVILGKPVAEVPRDLDPEITLVLGDCAAPYQDRGAFVPGCCPRPLDIGLVVRRIMGPMKVEIDFLPAIAAFTRHNLWRMGQRLRGRALPPIENHVPFFRVIKEYLQMLAIQKKNQKNG